MKLKICFLVLFSVAAASAAEFQDKLGAEVVSTRRSFKVQASDCKKSWEVSSESESSYCAVNVQNPSAMNINLAIIDADHIQFTCPVKDGSVTKQFSLEIVPHGTFGYVIQAQGEVLFASVERCLNEQIKVIPNQEVSVTFAKLKTK